ncbi:MAG: imidazoleglycerol-phosphate dehydratase HisB [candidate division WS1 bacterium]|jgi:imidazoleglycerol-phosphate dehydratase|nr:imidazoleglycerol-phosphate dehydratase HisB [candidate division WS1 bacterium]
MARTARIERKTAETDIALEINLDGQGEYEIATGIGFFDHMLTHVAKHGKFDLQVAAHGDLQVDQHHTVEDVGIVLGQALRQAVGDKAGMARFGEATAPMDEALVTAVIDFGGRPYLEYGLQVPTQKVGDFDTELTREFFLAVTNHAGLNLHLRQGAGDNSHHIIEAAFKAFARALDQATRLDPRVSGVPSTKGTL